MKTFSLKPAETQKKWVVIDADQVTLGRLAAEVAKRLRGKHRPDYTPHVDCGDKVIVVNAKNIRLTGKKRTDKVYYRHTGFPGGIKEQTPEKILNSAFPERVFQLAVKRMLPKESPLSRRQFTHLYVYGGSEHPHVAQNPEVIDFAAMNPKNKRSI
jgi:large subunit ribosomal protein L13